MQKRVPKKSYKRKVNIRLIKSNTSYFVKDLMEIFDVGETTVRYWLKLGLKTIDKKSPTMIYCEDLREFLTKKQNGNKKKCQDDEMMCFSCKNPRKVFESKVNLIGKNDKVLHLKANCKECQKTMTRKYANHKMAEIKEIFNLFY
jgi:hypothetical protein